MKFNYSFLLYSLLLVFISQSCNGSKSQNTSVPELGTYDGYLGNKKIILVAEETNEEGIHGYFIYSRNKAIEKPHKYTITLKGSQLIFVSKEVSGTINASFENLQLDGKLIVSRKSIFFWRNKRKFQLQLRTAPPEFVFNQRYKKPLFPDIQLEKDIVYGKAVGFWTETPYLDDPYVEILAKGMVNLFKGEKELELKMDVYSPKADSFKNRPLLLLVHGGGFYVGNKQSETERKLATHFAQLGYVVASIDYRMGFKMKAEDIERTGYKAIQDVHAALRYLSNKAEKYGINPNQIYAAGTSAGAISALNIAFLQNQERPLSTYEINSVFGLTHKEDLGFIEASGNELTDTFTIKAVGNMWGALSDIEILDANERIPVISFHGDNDHIVPFDHDYPFKNTMRLNRLVTEKMYGSKVIHERLDEMGVDNKLIVFNGKGHEPQLDNFKSTNTLLDLIVDELTTFLYRQTATIVDIELNALQLKNNSNIKPLEFNVSNGEIVQVVAKGGVLVSNKANETRIIWLRKAPIHQVIVYTKNDFDAWSSVSFNVSL